jgi:hypothetical protein
VQVAGALHQVRGNLYGNNTQTTISVGPNQYTGVAPADKWGYAAMAGLELNVPTGPGDKVWGEGVFTEGALAYAGLSQVGSFGAFDRFSGSTGPTGGLPPPVVVGQVAAGWALDGVFANIVAPATANTLNPSGILLTRAWSIGAAFEHHWAAVPARTSVFGVVTQVTYPGDITNLQSAKSIFCSSTNGPSRTFAGAAPNFATGPILGCNPDFRVWAVGTRTVWNPFRNMDVGWEVMYSRIEQNMQPANPAAPTGVLFNFGGGGSRAAGLYVPQDQSTWSGVVRFQYHFGTPPPEESRS